MPPFHPLCRCTTVPHYDNTPTEGLTRAARDADGNPIEVPEDMTYQEWKKVLEDGGDFDAWVNPEKSIAKAFGSGIIKPTDTKEEIQVHSVGKIDRDIYKCITDDIVTDEVIITDERIGHIKERHPNDYERYCEYLKLIIESPDYIIETNKPNTALILKEVKESEERQFKTVLRLTTSTDNPDFKNSIITFMKIDDKEWKRLLRNKQILYKRE